MKTLKQSLRKRPTYNELIDYLENDQPIIKYPDRMATFLRNSPYLSKYDDPSMLDLEEQENKMERERMKEAEVKRIVKERGGTAQLERYNISSPASYDAPADDYDDAMDSYLNDIEEDDETQRKTLEDRVRNYRTLSGFNEESLSSYYDPSEPTPTQTQASLPPLEDLDAIRAYGQLEMMASSYAGNENKKSMKILSDAIKHAATLKKFDKRVKEDQKETEQVQKIRNPFGLGGEGVRMPKRARSTTRKGTRRESDEPEELPRKARSLSRDESRIQQTISKLGMEAIPEKAKRGRKLGSTNKPKS